ncbi:hypothetical protein [Spirosoma aerolatum]|uniref:hypothetical protein n=1 Tax=Spirosoma aerolatum TaxID=1211326 RepID=UPI0009ADCC7F|nr:hypothetical protein [Spirosoma aerolatum]
MKSLIRVILVLLVIGGVIAIVISQRNHTVLSANTIDLRVDCSDIDNVLVTSSVNVAVQNLSSRSHNDISVKIRAYDEAGNLLKEKYTTFSRMLPPKSIFDKPVTLPAKTKRCDCQIVSSHPFN